MEVPINGSIIRQRFLDEFGYCKPLKGARIVDYFKPLSNAVCREILTDLGADVWDPDILFRQYQLASASAALKEAVEYWWDIDRALDWGPDGGPDLIIDDRADATLMILEGVKAEEIYAETSRLPDPCSTDSTKLQAILTIIKDGLETNPKRYHNIKQGLAGVCLGSTDCLGRLLQMQANGTLTFPVININDSVTNTKYNNVYGSRCAILGGIKRGTNMTISGKTALVCGYGDDASEACAMALKQGGANVVVVDADPNHGTQARLRGFPVIEFSDNVVPEVDIFVVNFNKGNTDVLNNIKNMKNNSIIFNMGNNSTYDALIKTYFSGMRQTILDCQTVKWVSSDTSKCVFVVSNPEYPNLMPSWSATAYVVAMLELMSQKETGKYVGKVYAFPEHLEEKVSDLLLGELKAAVPKKETEGQAADPVSVPSQERANPFTATIAGAMNTYKMLTMVIQVSIIGALAYAFSKVSKAELSFSAIWDGGN